MIHPEWSYSTVIYEMNIRQLTTQGTFRAAEQKLEFLRSIGIETLWLMPIYPIGEEDRKGGRGSYYSIKDYEAINPEFGTDEDFDSFLHRAHELGFKILLDWVANHTSRDARWISERPLDWYCRDEAGQAKVPWDWSDTAKLNYDNHEVWRGHIEAMKYWLKRGVDGFRCDMAMLVPKEFWQEVASELSALKPDLFMLAEAEESYLFDRAFDCCYAWELHHLMCDVAQGRRRADALTEYLHRTTDYPRWTMKLMFTSNHDENSWQGTEQSRFGASLDAMTVFSFVAPQGIPLIYTGQEVDYEHVFEFFEKDPIPAESYVDGDRTEFYRKLSHLKSEMTCLKAGEMGGSWNTIETNASDCLLVLARENDTDRVFVQMNMSPYVIQCQYSVGRYAGEYKCALSEEDYSLSQMVDEYMEPWSYRLLKQKK